MGGKIKFFLLCNNLFGIGKTRRLIISQLLGIPFDKVNGFYLSESLVKRIDEIVLQSYKTGKVLKENNLKYLKWQEASGCYKSFRRILFLPCNGQRTRTNAGTCKRKRLSVKRGVEQGGFNLKITRPLFKKASKLDRILRRVLLRTNRRLESKEKLNVDSKLSSKESFKLHEVTKGGEFEM